MLILVAVTVRTVIQSGLFSHAGNASTSYSKSQAKEILGTTLAGAQAEKYTNKNYDETGFLNNYIKDNIPGSKIDGNVITVDGWQFEIDRTTPKIVTELGQGNPEESIMPLTGDYVQYSPKPAESYLIEAKYSGYTADQSISQETGLKWRVLKIHDDGRIDLIAETPTDTVVYFQGALGVNNGVYLLNDLCKAQYSNEDYGAVGRSIDLEDIENRMSPAGITAKNNYINGKEQTYSGDNAYAPDIYEKVEQTTEGESLDGASGEEMPTTATYSKKDKLLVKQTIYGGTQQASYYDSTKFYHLIFKTEKNYWLASRYAHCDSIYAYFGLCGMYGTNICGNHLFESSNRMLTNLCHVRPVVTLGSEFCLQQVEGLAEWQIVRK